MLQKIHHVGIVVKSLDDAYRFYRDVLGLQVHREAVMPEQNVRAALLTLGDSEIELLEPIDTESGIAKFLAKRGEGLHHVCFQVDDVDADLAALKRKGVNLIDQETRMGLAGRICFLHPSALTGALVELCTPVD